MGFNKKNRLVFESKIVKGNTKPEILKVRQILKSFRWMPGIKYPGLVETHKEYPNGDIEIFATYNGATVNPGDWVLITNVTSDSVIADNEFKIKWEKING